MLFRIGCAARAQTVAMACADKFHQLARVTKTSVGGCEGTLPFRRIAAQGEYVLDTGVGEALENAGQIVARGAHAGQMCHGFDPGLAPNS